MLKYYNNEKHKDNILQNVTFCSCSIFISSADDLDIYFKFTTKKWLSPLNSFLKQLVFLSFFEKNS